MPKMGNHFKRKEGLGPGGIKKTKVVEIFIFFKERRMHRMNLGEKKK